MIAAATTPSFIDRALGLFRHPPENPVLRENAEYFSDFDQDRPLADYEFCVVDTELTGLSSRTDEIVSIGAVRIKNLSITANSYYSLVAPKGELPKLSTMIHRITPEMLKDAPRLRTIFPEFMNFCGHSLIVGHNIGLDMSFLNRAGTDILGGKLSTPCIDTMRLSQIYQQELWENYYDQFDGQVSYQLYDLSNRYGLPSFNQHNALYDAMQTAYLFLFLVKKLRSGGIKTLRDLYLAGRSWRWYF
ncbi:PolC-type DNA polymerase III [Desulfovibrio ferrophilus]|uniref:Exonuclease, DNA polymerase III, epsilon subunit family n=1 Tax=Desulfovibrio ferrophilus TaxID=241368 RepID=A0A2Z6B2H2_9BACT|nr:3'-5' exonuclease [Desulfovibrio ferrophilus]BBD09714.1 exonuclease, DNA polymerase III, epsilon subunit family [Desulfovibrio ferrophilus]